MYLVTLHGSLEKNELWERKQSHDQFVKASSYKCFFVADLNRLCASAERESSGNIVPDSWSSLAEHTSCDFLYTHFKFSLLIPLILVKVVQ